MNRKTLSVLHLQLLVVFMVTILTQPFMGCSSSDAGGGEGTETTADGTTGDESSPDTLTATDDAGPEGSTDSAEATDNDVNATDSEQGMEDVTEQETDVMEADGE